MIQPPQGTVIAPPGGTAGQTTSSGERLRVIDTGGSGANLRESPSSGAAIVKTAPEGALLQVVGPDRQAEGRTWRNVRDADGAQGWVAAELVERAP